MRTETHTPGLRQGPRPQHPIRRQQQAQLYLGQPLEGVEHKEFENNRQYDHPAILNISDTFDPPFREWFDPGIPGMV